MQGKPAAVEAIIVWARRGPSGAVVSEITVTEGHGEYATFEMRPTD